MDTNINQEVIVEDESTEKFKKYVQDRITQLRLQKDISETQLSYELGQSKSYIHNLTSGHNLPLLLSLHNICEYFGITEAEFFDPTLHNPTLSKKIQEKINQLCHYDEKKLEQFYYFLSSLTPELLAHLYKAIYNFVKAAKNINFLRWYNE